MTGQEPGSVCPDPLFTVNSPITDGWFRRFPSAPQDSGPRTLLNGFEMGFSLLKLREAMESVSDHDWVDLPRRPSRYSVNMVIRLLHGAEYDV